MQRINDNNPLGFHVPEPSARPEEQPDFSHIRLSDAGAIARPPVDCDPAITHETSCDLIRVLDDDGKANGPWDPKLSATHLREALALMCLTRAYDDRMFKLQRQGKMSFYVKALGEEAVAIAAARAMNSEDMMFPSYRQQGILFARNRDMVEMMCHCISNSKDNLKGRQLPIHYTWAEGNFFSISGNLGTQFPQAVGWAMAAQAKGETAIAASWVGDGTTAEGDFHAALTLANVYRAPVILNVVNNQWAISSFAGIASGAQPSFAARGIGYGIPGLRVDGNDYLALFAATKWAAERARSGLGATLIESVTYRGESHSTSDDPGRYRPKDEWKSWPLGDPILRLQQHLIALGEWGEKRQQELETAQAEQVRLAYKEATSFGTLREGPLAPTSTIFDDLFVEQPWHLRRQRQDLGV
ncbi:MAG: 3-methyl-2-oxobutanoate dehydrogenase (2-methylpropanoyl-transferring) subunit alpha [Robiginitomaculum sp.]|nr:MAG: 3-methyl-2-oxobutanoate dehydrogenase (2-methylpropanoyl-transferring) subunit alpha [Robiginitomaculum sp.]